MNLTKQQYADMEEAHRTWDENERVDTHPHYYQIYHAFRYATERTQGEIDKLLKVIETGDIVCTLLAAHCSCGHCCSCMARSERDELKHAAGLDQREAQLDA